MKKLNEAQMIIFEEESARAIMLKKAKESLSEAHYQGLLSVLPEYESKADAAGVSRIELYEGFFDKLKQAGSGLMNIGTGLIGGLAGKAQNFSDRNMTAKQIEKELQSILQDRDTQILFDKVKNPDSYMEKGAFSQQDMNAAKIQAEFVLRNIRILFNRLGALDPNLKAQDNAQSLANIAKILGMDPKELLAMYGKGAKQAQQSQKSKLPPQDQAYVDFRKPGKGGGGKTGGDGGDDDGGDDKPDDKPEEKTPDEKPEEKAPEAKKPVDTVRSVQRPIINLVQRVAAAQGVDVSVKQAQEIAIVITKNLVNQMRANGVEFKGVTKDLKESLVADIQEILGEARLARSWMQDNMKTQSKTGAKNTGVRIGSQWIATADELFRKIKANGLHTVDGFQDNMEQMKREPNNYIDFLDIAQDLGQLMPREVITAAHSGARRRRDELEELKDSLMITLKLYKQFKIVQIEEDGKKPSKFGNITKIKFTRDARKKYAELKREVGTVDSKKKGTKLGQDKQRIAGDEERAKERIAKGKIDKPVDDSLAKPVKGKVNISQTVAKAIKKSGLDQDVAKKITPILKDKIAKIIARHMDKDVKYLEEKINRYVGTVIKEIK